MASIPSNMFTCNGGYCTDATVVPHYDQARNEIDQMVIPMSADVTCYYLIRGGIRLGDGVCEQDVIDVLEEQGYRAMWVDSESDARAQAMEFGMEGRDRIPHKKTLQDEILLASRAPMEFDE